MSQHPGRAVAVGLPKLCLSDLAFNKTLPSPRLDPPRGRVALGIVGLQAI